VEPSAGTATCYRHPDREAPLRCTRCDRPICLQDAIDAPVGYLCPEDARQPKRVQRVQRRVAAGMTAPVTRGLVGVLVVAYLLQQAGGITGLGVTNGPAIAAGQWWRVVTGAFLHASLIHIGFNAYLLWMLGNMLEPSMGRARFGAVYVAGLAGGSAGALLLSWGASTLGASGAVSGLMGAAMVLLRRRGINPWQTSIGTLVLINLAFTFVFPGISIGGHLGGLAGGALAASVLASTQQQGAKDLGGVWGVALGLLALALFLGVAGPVLPPLPGPF